MWVDSSIFRMISTTLLPVQKILRSSALLSELDKSVAATALKLREEQNGAKAAFDTATRNFQRAKEKR